MITEKIGLPAMYEMLAEECVELAHEALKMARIIRGENPTPKTEDAVKEHLIEETTDVFLCLAELNLSFDPQIMGNKQRRFEQRWSKAHEVTQDDLADIAKMIKESGE